MTDWMTEALCARVPDWPDRERDAEARGGDWSELQAVCAGCGVRAECLAHGLSLMERHRRDDAVRRPRPGRASAAAPAAPPRSPGGGLMTRSATLVAIVSRHQILTANQRLHWAPKAARTHLLRTRGATVWASAGRPRFDRAQLTVTIGYPDRRKRDAHNLMPTIKALIDGMVHPYCGAVGVLPDDSDTYLTGPDLRVGEVTPGYFTLAFDFEETP